MLHDPFCPMTHENTACLIPLGGEVLNSRIFVLM